MSQKRYLHRRIGSAIILVGFVCSSIAVMIATGFYVDNVYLYMLIFFAVVFSMVIVGSLLALEVLDGADI